MTMAYHHQLLLLFLFFFYGTTYASLFTVKTPSFIHIVDNHSIRQYENGSKFQFSAEKKKKSGGGGFGGGGATKKKKNKKGKDSLPTLSTEAKKLLKQYKNDVDSASTAYFQSQMMKTSLSSDDNTKEEQHLERVAATWNTIALFLPNDYKHGVDLKIQRRLQCIADAASLQSMEKSVLDVGCGDGSLVPYLFAPFKTNDENANKVWKAYKGLDISQIMIDLAQERWSQMIAPQQWTVGSFPHTEEKFDVIIFNGSLQFFPDTNETLKQAYHLLNKGGRIVISHVNGSTFVKEECIKNPGVAVRNMPNKTSLQIIADTLEMNLLEQTELPLTLDEDDIDNRDFYLMVLEKLSDA